MGLAAVTWLNVWLVGQSVARGGMQRSAAGLGSPTGQWTPASPTRPPDRTRRRSGMD